MPASAVLERAIIERVGQERMSRVTNWTAWREAIKVKATELLVVLGHTQFKDFSRRSSSEDDRA
jgi:hypothetical protein